MPELERVEAHLQFPIRLQGMVEHRNNFSFAFASICRETEPSVIVCKTFPEDTTHRPVTQRLIISVTQRHAQMNVAVA